MIDFLFPQQAALLMNSLAAKEKPFLFAFDYQLSKAFVIENALNQQEVLFLTPSYTNSKNKAINKKADIVSHAIEYSAYKKGFEVISKALFMGNTYLANYTVSTPIELNCSLKDIFYLANSPFKLYLPNHFLSFSPERFVRIEDGKIFTYPMKGTIDATIPNARERILNDKKETSEHITVVDLLRNDIGMVAKNVEVTRFRYIDKIKTQRGSILQVSSEIIGDLDNNWRQHIGDIILKLLPAGSICGAPKQSTLKAIGEAESRKRGFYSGVFGYFDGQSLDSAVLIRFIEQIEERYYFHSGGGITVNSECYKEYQEVNQKIYLPL